MNVAEMTKDEAIEHVRLIAEKKRSGKQLEPSETYFLLQIEYYVEQKVIADIAERQKRIPDLKVTRHGYSAVWGDDLTPGCTNCLDGTGLGAIRSVSQCNLKCKFCYYVGDQYPNLLGVHFGLGDKLYTEDDIKMMLDKAEKKPEGVCWVYFEPFMDFDKHPGLIRYISQMGIHQHLYTNGTLCTEEHFKILQDCGLPEIRFDLAATHCSRKILKTMTTARKYFEYLCIESPMFGEYFGEFLANQKEILETGVDHMNFAELHLRPGHKDFVSEPLYRYKYGYTSPISSRQLTYDVIEIASQEKWKDVTINDCSNATKFYRSSPKHEQWGTSNWRSPLGLPPAWYEDALTRHELSCFKPAEN